MKIFFKWVLLVCTCFLAYPFVKDWGKGPQNDEVKRYVVHHCYLRLSKGEKKCAAFLKKLAWGKDLKGRAKELYDQGCYLPIEGEMSERQYRLLKGSDMVFFGWGEVFDRVEERWIDMLDK